MTRSYMDISQAEHYCPMPFAEFEKLALGLLNDDLSAEQRFVFVSFLGYHPEASSFFDGCPGKCSPRRNQMIGPLVHGFLRNKMDFLMYEMFMYAVLGFDPDPEERLCDENIEQIKRLYSEAGFSYMIFRIAQENIHRVQGHKTAVNSSRNFGLDG